MTTPNQPPNDKHFEGCPAREGKPVCTCTGTRNTNANQPPTESQTLSNLIGYCGFIEGVLHGIKSFVPMMEQQKEAIYKAYREIKEVKESLATLLQARDELKAAKERIGELEKSIRERGARNLLRAVDRICKKCGGEITAVGCAQCNQKEHEAFRNSCIDAIGVERFNRLDKEADEIVGEGVVPWEDVIVAGINELQSQLIALTKAPEDAPSTVPILAYLYEQFPATVGHIPLGQMLDAFKANAITATRAKERKKLIELKRLADEMLNACTRQESYDAENAYRDYAKTI